MQKQVYLDRDNKLEYHAHRIVSIVNYEIHGNLLGYNILTLKFSHS